VATIIWNCSVVHSLDHWEIWQIPMEHKPTRLRVPPPFERTDCAFEPGELTVLDDRVRQYMWHEMYIRPWPIKRLVDVDYQFHEPALQSANRAFLQALAGYATSRAPNDYCPLGEIATSIQH
jgi:hypothetical protein